MGLAKEDGARNDVDRRENFVCLQRPAIANVRQAQVKIPMAGIRLQVVPKENIVELVVLITGPDFLMSSCRWF
jgi:hypothetical protein